MRKRLGVQACPFCGQVDDGLNLIRAEDASQIECLRCNPPGTAETCEVGSFLYRPSMK